MNKNIILNRTHPTIPFIRDGFPMIISSDNPGTFGTNNLSYDWYMIGQHNSITRPNLIPKIVKGWNSDIWPHWRFGTKLYVGGSEWIWSVEFKSVGIFGSEKWRVLLEREKSKKNLKFSKDSWFSLFHFFLCKMIHDYPSNYVVLGIWHLWQWRENERIYDFLNNWHLILSGT